MEDYNAIAESFAKKYGVTLKKISMRYGKYFVFDREERYIFKMRLGRGKKSYTFEFGQSLHNGNKEPSAYDVLSCLTKNDPESFEDFCGNFGYDTDSREAYRIYRNVQKEWIAVERLFGDVIDELADIE